ncbi:hypothetical protein [Krasilnikoviella flava]|uniref:Uncharacterized protein n=1 Tax=Krasilnikoviella flava TaxID=526729 RepID=A0A1T5LGH4_9MICO|nr:hypothetical protein [Krasilnikoviella flava]SKC75103.1 hypothetical protein SAMN04324258_3369 [Krasilnikoviella flava]
MSTNHARDDWADARTDEALRRELDTLAGLGASASTLDDALGSVGRRVRRRRTVKQAGIGATTLAVAAGLVLGGAALLPDAPQPLPGPANSPTPSPSDDTPRDGARAADLIRPGYQPGWLEGTGLTCGMPAEDVPTTRAQGYKILVAGDDPHLGGPATDEPAILRLDTWTVVGETPPEDGVLTGPTLLWAQDGQVVDLGINMTEDPVDVRPGRIDRTAEDSTLTTCAPDGEAEGTTSYATPLPDGEYQVTPYDVVWSDDFQEHVVVAGPWLDVRVDADGATLIAPLDTAGEASDTASEVGDCSAAGLDVPEPDVAELPEPVQDTARTLLEAATSCDDQALTTLAEAAGRHDLNWGGQPPRDTFALPDAEQDDDVYAILARLLVGTTPCVIESQGDDGVERAYSWPRVNPGGCEATTEDWQDAVDAGAITAREAEEMRDAGRSGYEGWRVVIREDGGWMQFVDGYLGPPRGE